MIMDQIKAYLMRAGKMHFGTTAEVCDAIGKQIDSDLANSGKPNDVR